MSKIINDDFSINLKENIEWQYENAPALSALIVYKDEFQKRIVHDFFDDWYKDVFNIKTASYFGLIVWAIILGCTGYIELTYRIGKKTFGFGEAHKNFHESNFSLSSYILSLTAEQLRRVLTAQMFNFQSNGSLYDINRALSIVFPGYGAYAERDYENNTIVFHFEEELSDDDLNIITFSNVLQTPIGVKRLIKYGGDEE